MAKKPDYSGSRNKGLGAGRAESLKSRGPRNPLNEYASRAIERGADMVELQKSAEGTVLGRDAFKRALDTAGEFRDAQQRLAKAAGDPMMSEPVKFTRRGAAGTTPIDTLKKVGVGRADTFDEVAARMGALFGELKKGSFGDVMKKSSGAIKAAAAGGDKAAISILKSRVFQNLAKEGLVGLALGVLSDTGKPEPKNVEEAVMSDKPGA